MDQKTWLWRKRLPEKTIVANGKTDVSPEGNGEEVLPNEKEVALKESLELLNEELASALRECKAKDELVADHVRRGEEVLAGKEKAEADVLHLREELNEALQGRAADNERIGHLNAALKDCMQQLSSAREEQDQRVHDAVISSSKELDRAHKKLEERLTMMSKRLTNLTVENSHLNKAMREKEMLIEDLSKFKTQAEAEFHALMARSDSTEKENAFLRYEYQMLEKELDIQNEDRKLTRYSLDASNKQYLESLKKIKKLESECQRLRVLARKRLPGPAALVKMTREVEIHNGHQIQTRTRKKNSMTGGLVVRDSTWEPLQDIPSKNESFLVECLRDVEHENKVLREILMQRDGEINFSKLAVSKLSPVETGQESRLLSCGLFSSSLPSELKQFKHGDAKDIYESKTFGISEMNLMDDFVEMEKLAIVSVDSQLQSTDTSSNVSSSLISSSTTADINSTCKELVLVGQDGFGDKDQGLQTRDSLTRSANDWLQHVLNDILEQKHVSGRSLEELVEEIVTALHKMNHLCTIEASKSAASMDPKPMQLPISGLITWKSPVTSPRVDSIKGSPENGNLMGKARNETSQSILDSSICKIIEIVRTLGPREQSTPQRQQPTAAMDYIIHVFRWKRCEFTAVLQEFVDTCNNLLDGKVTFEKFAEVLASELSWIMENCVPYGENSSIKDELDKLLNEDGSKAETEIELREKLMSKMEKFNYIVQVENKGLEVDLNTAKSSERVIETRLKAENDKNTAFTNEPQQSRQSIESLKTELQTLRESKRMIEDQIENQKSINEDLDTQLTVAKSKLNEALQKLSSLEVELENKSHCCEELEGTCLELQLQLESITNKGGQNGNRYQEDKALKTSWEITAASAKLDECQETILKLGKQLKALSSSKETMAVDKAISISSTKNENKKLNRHLSLLDRMQFEDSTEEADDMKSPMTKEIISTCTAAKKPSFPQPDSHNTSCVSDVPVVTTPDKHPGLRCEANTPNARTLAIVPSKKRGGGISFLKKLLLRRKNGSRKKVSFYLAA